MDPSEFEDTVERHEDVVNAGVLEDIFVTAKPKFTTIDLAKETGELYMQIYTIKESIVNWSNISFSRLKEDWDSQAVRIADLKEAYVTRKKALATKVRSYTATFLDSSVSTDTIQYDDIVPRTRVLINDFKADFDELSAAAKFSETSFLNTYKQLREFDDPVATMQSCLTVCLKAQELLKVAQERLDIAASSMDGGIAPSFVQNQPNTEEINKLAKELEKEQEVQQRLHADMVDMRARFEIELRNREQSLRDSFEKQQLQLQQQWENALAEKDNEMSSLLSSLNELNQKIMEAEHREKMLVSETQKRRDVEDRLRGSLTELAEVQTQLQEMTVNFEAAKFTIDSMESQLDRNSKQAKHESIALQSELDLTKQKQSELESELTSRPPVDLSSFASRIGLLGHGDLLVFALADKTMDVTEVVDGSDTSESSWGDEGKVEEGAVAKTLNGRPTRELMGNQGRLLTKKQQMLTWATIETFVVENIRKANADAADCRVKEQAAQRQCTVAENELEIVKKKLADTVLTTAALERDLLAAHNSVEAGKSLIKCFQSQGATAGTQHSLDTERSLRSTGKSNGGGHVDGLHIVVSASANDIATGVDRGVLSHDASTSLYSVGRLSRGVALTAAAGEDDLLDVEKGSGGRGTAAVILGGLDASDRMMQAVQGQRDRYMKAAQEKEQEVNLLRNRLERAQEEQVTLRNENMELYRRIRMLRASSRSAGEAEGRGRAVSSSSSSSSSSGVSSSAVARGGRGGRLGHTSYGSSVGPEGEGDGDALDHKYQQLYEDKIDPFRMTEELDRQAALSRFNVLEQGLAFVVKYLLQDRWVRHVVLVYLCLVHLFALGYVVQVLNPQLVEEVDQLKDQWSQETFDMDMNREHPDIRFR